MRALLLLAALLLAGCGAPDDAGEPATTPGPTPVPSTEPPGNTSAPQWRTLAPAPTPRSEVAATAYGHEILVVGGFHRGGGASDTVERYDTINGTWRAGPAYPLKVHHAMAATLDEQAYVFGGYGADGIARVEVYRLDGPVWTRMADMPDARGAGAAAAISSGIVVAGGIGTDGKLSKSAHLFDGREWTALPEFPRPRDHLAAASLDGSAYFLAGRLGGWGSNRAFVDRFDGTAWVQEPDAPTARGGVAAAAWNGSIVLVGGEEERGTFDESERYQPGVGWSALPAMPTARHGLGAANVNGTFYAVMGGLRPGLDVSGTVDSYS